MMKQTTKCYPIIKDDLMKVWAIDNLNFGKIKFRTCKSLFFVRYF